MIPLTTYEVRCTACGELKWPRLPDRPTGYVCVLCRAVGPAEVARRQETAQKSAETRRTRQQASGDAP